MTEVFIAYQRDDSEKATFIRAKLEALGVTVFHDVDIGQYGGDTCHYSKIIDRQLEDARAVVVLWTKASVASDWVRGEADKGWNRKVLVPAYFGDIVPRDLPVPHNGLQPHDLSGWFKNGRCKSDRECCNFLKTLGDKVGRPGLPLLAEAMEDGKIEIKTLFLRKYSNDNFAKQFRLDIEQDERKTFLEHLNALQLTINADIASKTDLLTGFQANFDAQLSAFRQGDDTILIEPEKRVINLLPTPAGIADAQISRLQAENDARAATILKMKHMQRAATFAATGAVVCFLGLLGFNLTKGPAIDMGRSVLPLFKSASVLCDALAAYEYDPDRPATSGWVKWHDKIAADDATRFCQQALNSAPDGTAKRRLLVQLGRAMAAQGYFAAADEDIGTAEQLYSKALNAWNAAKELGSGQANVVLGAFYRGSFAPLSFAHKHKNPSLAWQNYSKAAERRNPLGLTMAALYLLFPEEYDNAAQADYVKGKEYLDRASPFNLALTNYAQGWAEFNGRGYERNEQQGVGLISLAACKGEDDAHTFFHKLPNYKQQPCSTR